VLVGPLREAQRYGVLHERDEGREVAAHVQEPARLLVEADLRERQHLERLVVRAEATGERYEGVGEEDHPVLAVVHALRHEELGETPVRHLALHEPLGHHAHHPSPRGERGIGHRAHEADVRPAVDERETAPGDRGAHPRGGGRKGGIGAGPRAAEHADGLDGAARNHRPERSMVGRLAGMLRPVVATHGPADALGLVGSTIDQVRFDACVDAGGFGLIYRGFHEGLGETVAIKCLRLASILKTNEALREALEGRFRDETKLLYRLSQGNLDIVRCISSGTLVAPRTKETTPYMVLEWLDGCTLSVELKERRDRHLGVRNLEQAVKLLDSAVGGLAYAHSHEVVHRDVKPGNLFLTRTREGVRLKVLDFGLAKILCDEAIGIRPSVETGIGVHFCSPSYGAPEQYSSQIGKIGPSTDVYSLTLVLYEIMLGEKVRPAGNLAEGLLKAIDPATGSPSASDLGLEVPRAVEVLLKKALAQNPAQRPHDAGVFWSLLKDAMAAPEGHYGATVADAGLGSAMQNVRDEAVRRAAVRTRPSPFAGTMLMQNAPKGAGHLVTHVAMAPAPVPDSVRLARERDGEMSLTMPLGATSPLAASMAIPSPLQNASSSRPPPPFAGASGPPPPFAGASGPPPPFAGASGPPPPFVGASGPPPPNYPQQPQLPQVSSVAPGGSVHPGARAAMRTDPRMGLAPASGRRSGGSAMLAVAGALLLLLALSYYWLHGRGR